MNATVEVLTAEVRTLMVGSRQVTLSVYRQLDEVSPWTDHISTFEPFGRVRSGTLYPYIDLWEKACKVEADVEFVGRRHWDGSLVRMVVLFRDYRRMDDETSEQIKEWKVDLPLIVLAGLR